MPRRRRHDRHGDGQGHRRDLHPGSNRLGRLRELQPEVDAAAFARLRSPRIETPSESSRLRSFAAPLGVECKGKKSSDGLCFDRDSFLPALKLGPYGPNSVLPSFDCGKGFAKVNSFARSIALCVRLPGPAKTRLCRLESAFLASPCRRLRGVACSSREALGMMHPWMDKRSKPIRSQAGAES